MTTTTGTALAGRGRLVDLAADVRDRLLASEVPVDRSVRAQTLAIIDQVRNEGDAALRRLAARFDGVASVRISVPRELWQRAWNDLPGPLAGALERAHTNILNVHRAMAPKLLEAFPLPGVTIRRRPIGLDRVGAYVPGGRAAYPSTLLMTVAPARAAGVGEILVCSPPRGDGLPSPEVMAAAHLAGCDRLMAIGGAGAIAAMAYGTESVPRVDKIVGPGNAWVDEAKRLVRADVDVDCPAGPSELLVVADADAAPSRIAAELLAQAEHDPRARVGALVEGVELAANVEHEIDRQCRDLTTADTARKALATTGFVLAIERVEDAIPVAENFAPEHLLLLCRDSARLAPSFARAGAVFSGPAASVVFGDYNSGANHVLPTAAAASRQSGLSTVDFVRWVSEQHFDTASRVLIDDAACIARAEGLPGHAAAVERVESCTSAPSPSPRPEVAALPRYQPGARTARVELSDNTNLFRVPPAAARLGSVFDTPVGRYPTVYGDELCRELARHLGVESDQVASGCGSDDLLDSTLRAFVPPGGALAYSAPTFSMVSYFGSLAGARCIAEPARADLVPDTKRLAALGAEVVYLCRPENPSGVLVPRQDVVELARRVRLLVLDEAYVEFADEESLAGWAAGQPNVVVIRTFSKLAGLAGLRAGYAVAAAPLIHAIERARGPYKLSVVAERAAIEALREDPQVVGETLSRTLRERRWLLAELSRRGLRTWPSRANFVLVALPLQCSATAVGARLRTFGIGTRPFPDVTGLPCLRVTVGPRTLLREFLDALDRVLLEVLP